ncbi:MAG: hypothetical protein GTN76_03800 [Candidatus Aenigmarchaeota archaeon]|nr:hypothetical protein [Candidatus Aenigmarchaeota archaeon]
MKDEKKTEKTAAFWFAKELIGFVKTQYIEGKPILPTSMLITQDCWNMLSKCLFNLENMKDSEIRFNELKITAERIFNIKIVIAEDFQEGIGFTRSEEENPLPISFVYDPKLDRARKPLEE